MANSPSDRDDSDVGLSAADQPQGAFFDAIKEVELARWYPNLGWGRPELAQIKLSPTYIGFRVQR
jgi:hypothetical protein